MSTTHWRTAATGDFAKKGKWDDGVPKTHVDAVIAATGAAYTVKVISADAAHALTLDSIDATLLEKTHGSLHAGTLNLEAGTAILTQANTFGSIAMTGGELEFSNSAALGDADLSITGKAILAATGDVEISNDITVVKYEADFAVQNGKIFKLDGNLALNSSVATTLDFIGTGSNHKGNGTGVVDIDGTISAALQPASHVNIQGVTLASTVANNSALVTILSATDAPTHPTFVMMTDHAVLDLTGQNNIASHLASDATAEIVNSGARENFTLVGSGFNGELQGDFDLTIDAGILGGTIALRSGDVIHVIDGCTFENAHFDEAALAIDLDNGTSGSILTFNGVTFSGAAPAVDLGTGQNNKLTIDPTFSGTISNFGGHNGGTDHIVVNNEKIVSLDYKSNADGTGGELLVNEGTSSAFTLNFEGHYKQGDFVIGEVNDEIDCSAEQSPPHVPAHVLDALI